MLSRCFLDCSVGVGVFVTGLSQISSFFSYNKFDDYATTRSNAFHANVLIIMVDINDHVLLHTLEAFDISAFYCSID